MGQCLLFGWSEKQFWFSSFRAIYNLLLSARNQSEQESRERWEQTRMICDFVLAPHRRKGATGRSFSLPWDGEVKEETIKVLSPEEKEEIFQKWDRKIKKKFNAE